LFKNPLHPYTKALLNSVPKLKRRDRLESIKGNVPNLLNPPTGCRFHPRCPHVMDICRKEKPLLQKRVDPGGREHLIACFLYKK
jgi:peptide/nickel transport system ATP-binding protein